MNIFLNLGLNFAYICKQVQVEKCRKSAPKNIDLCS